MNANLEKQKSLKTKKKQKKIMLCNYPNEKKKSKIIKYY